MEVKIYREPENETLMINEDHLEEYNKLASELGLQSLEQAEKKKTPNVYPCLNQAMQRQLKALCPSEIKAEEYKRSTIPLDVLKVYKYAKDNEMFEKFVIWYADKDPDPMLIGWNWMSAEDKKNNYSWRGNHYLIARWGDCALEMDQLLQKGYNAIKQSVIDSATLASERVESMVKNPDAYVRMFLKGDNLDIKINTEGSINELPF